MPEPVVQLCIERVGTRVWACYGDAHAPATADKVALDFLAFLQEWALPIWPPESPALEFSSQALRWMFTVFMSENEFPSYPWRTIGQRLIASKLVSKRQHDGRLGRDRQGKSTTLYIIPRPTAAR